MAHYVGIKITVGESAINGGCASNAMVAVDMPEYVCE